VGPLHDWYFDGDHPLVDEDHAGARGVMTPKWHPSSTPDKEQGTPTRYTPLLIVDLGWPATPPSRRASVDDFWLLAWHCPEARYSAPLCAFHAAWAAGTADGVHLAHLEDRVRCVPVTRSATAPGPCLQRRGTCCRWSPETRKPFDRREGRVGYRAGAIRTVGK